MAEVKILIEGYAKPFEKGWKANATVCLVKTSDGKKILTDPGCNRVALLDALEKEGIATGDIDFVFLSHRHPDHVLLAGLFEKAKFITFDMNTVYESDSLIEFPANILGDEVEIVNTPGHVNEHLSLVVKTERGRVAIAGDTIWWIDNEEQVFRLDQKDHNQAIDLDMEKLIQSRKKLLEIADWIVPGHGKMFKAPKKL